jgi:hypothetical protein
MSSAADVLATTAKNLDINARVRVDVNSTCCCGTGAVGPVRAHRAQGLLEIGCERLAVARNTRLPDDQVAEPGRDDGGRRSEITRHQAGAVAADGVTIDPRARAVPSRAGDRVDVRRAGSAACLQKQRTPARRESMNGNVAFVPRTEPESGSVTAGLGPTPPVPCGLLPPRLAPEDHAQRSNEDGRDRAHPHGNCDSVDRDLPSEKKPRQLCQGDKRQECSRNSCCWFHRDASLLRFRTARLASRSAAPARTRYVVDGRSN